MFSWDKSSTTPVCFCLTIWPIKITKFKTIGRTFPLKNKGESITNKPQTKIMQISEGQISPSKNNLIHNLLDIKRFWSPGSHFIMDPICILTLHPQFKRVSPHPRGYFHGSWRRDGQHEGDVSTSDMFCFWVLNFLNQHGSTNLFGSWKNETWNPGPWISCFQNVSSS